MFEGWALRQAIRSALNKPAPKRYSLTAQNRKNIDYRTVVLKFNEKNESEIMIQSMSKDGVFGLIWNGECFEDEVCVPLQYIYEASFSLHRALGSNMYNFKTPRSYLVAEWSMKLYFQELRDRLGQTGYNLRLKERNNRSQLLQDLVRLEMERISREEMLIYRADEARSHIDLFSEVYGNRIWGHPNYRAYLAKFQFVLQSFVESGELKQDTDGRYTVSPASLNTLAKDAIDDQRHNDTKRQNMWIIVLTSVLAVPAIFQIFDKFE